MQMKYLVEHSECNLNTRTNQLNLNSIENIMLYRTEIIHIN